MRSARDLLNVDEELLDDDIDELELEDLLALWNGVGALERAIEDRIRRFPGLEDLEE